ncbi:1,3-propanediol dehydrogenase [Aquisphaera giovannonii]|uniref:1,3-propanediol dehydrogenase n=1 Tax=Aquisphaera giovannonii TaxID=406548 RepID=A0A5B9W414_9BACT|nr:iron-containing alcohol dehydrogenase [Aquisphaera giovannonii]QEH34929.1 1,3-propanediol dehydrogenase [Aquisphaera giovannonii]
MTFEFATAGRILFGRGAVRQVPELARGLGKRALLVLGRSGRGGDEMAAALEGAGIPSARYHVGGEPTTTMVDEASALARGFGCDLVVSLGGGSVIDLGKAVAGMLANPGEVLDYLEVVGRGMPLANPALPSIAIPTTSGTGAEVTRNAVLDVAGKDVKVSLRSFHLLPRAAVVDPSLTDGLPPAITAYTGMDAVTQLIEAFVGNAANPMTDGVCREGLRLAAGAIVPAVEDGSNQAARDAMSVAATFSGMALANAKLGAVHGFAGVLGGVTGHAHGAICARLLPFVCEANVRALRRSPEGTRTLDRYAEVARILTGDPSARPEGVADWARRVGERFAIPTLGAGGLEASAIPAIIPSAERASSMQGNPIKLPADELRAILEAAL